MQPLRLRQGQGMHNIDPNILALKVQEQRQSSFSYMEWLTE